MKSLEEFLEEEGFTEAEVLGEGSSATVLVAFSEKEGFDVALKVLSKKLDEFEIEDEVLTQLSVDKRIIKKFRTINRIDMKHAVIVLEMLDHDLMDTIEATGCFKENKARAIFYNICRGVLFCHNNHIAHMDIKPENILLDRHEERAVLSDFGTAIRFEPRQPIKLTPVGTFFYCAPEISKKQDVHPDKADIWSLGVLLHVMLTGTWPYAGNNYDEACANAERGIVHCLAKKLSPTALSLIQSMVNVDIQKRYSIIEVLEHPWFGTFDRRSSELEHKLAFDLNPVVTPTSVKTPRGVFIDAEVNSPRTSKLDASSCLSPRVVNLNDTPLSLRLSQVELKSKVNQGLKTPRKTDSLTPRITANPEAEPTKEELEQLGKKKQPGTLTSLFKRVKEITSFKK